MPNLPRQSIVAESEPPIDQPVVYVFQQPTAKGDWIPDLTPAAAFGRIEHIFDAEDRPHISVKGAVAKARLKLANFRPEVDYLLWPNFADVASMWVVVALLTRGGHYALRYLYWQKAKGSDAKDGYYYPVSINVGSQPSQSYAE